MTRRWRSTIGCRATNTDPSASARVDAGGTTTGPAVWALMESDESGTDNRRQRGKVETDDQGCRTMTPALAPTQDRPLL